MNNEELKKKILSIVRGAMLEADELPFIETTDNIADALIAAGIGDVKESENKATAAELVAQVSASTAIEKIAEWKHRAARAEKALKIADELGELCAPVCDYVDKAEKELAEEGKDENY